MAKWSIAFCIMVSFAIYGVTTAQEVPPRSDTGVADPPRVTRAKRPQFRFSDWEGIYFENIFRDGLVGAQPELDKSPPAVTQPPALSALENEPAAGSSTWARLINAEVIEDEIKRSVTRLSSDVATPSKYQSDYLSARQSFSMLSFWFAVIYEYQDTVRWSQHASSMQPAMARAAANSRVSSEQSFQYARARLEALQQLLRGETPAQVEPPAEAIDWPYAVGRSPIMIRMQECFDELKPLVADASGFRRARDEVEHQSQVLAALSQALMQPDMDDADESDYTKHARGMINDALALLQAARLDQYEDAEKSVKRIERRCSNCHEEWR